MSSRSNKNIRYPLFLGTKLLDLRLNKLEILEELEFAGLNYLESLHLDLNQITLVKQGAFRGLKKLIYLYLSQNNIKYLMVSFKVTIFS